MISRSGNMKIAPMAPVKVMSLYDSEVASAARGNEPHRSPWPFRISRARSPACPSSRASTCSRTRPARRCTSARRACCATASAAISAAQGTSPRIDALLREAAGARGHRHRLGGRGAGAREPPHQAAQPALQHPAPRRQDLSVPAADDDASARRACSSRAASSATATSTPGPFMPAALARRTMSLTHRLFGIRSCNEVIDGERGPAVPRVRHQALHRAVRRARSARSSGTARAVEQARLLLEGRQDELVDRAARARWPTPRPTSASSRRRSCATPSARSRRCAIGSRRWRRRRSAIATRSA